jgi:hypothetical protein
MIERLDRFWRRPMPATRLATLRLLVGAFGAIYLSVRTPHLLSYALDDVDRFRPVGVIALGGAPILPAVYQALVIATVILAFPFLAGWRHRILAPIYAALLWIVLTYSNSWGQIMHTDNLFLLHVVVLALTPSADVLSMDAKRRGPPERHVAKRYGWPIRLLVAVGALAYLLAGVAKLQNSGFDFVAGETLRNYVGFDNVRKIELGSVHSPLGAWLLPYPAFFAVLAWVSFVLELGAPIAVIGRRIGKLWAIAVWGFHVGVLALMAIGFVYQLTFVAFAPYFDVEKLWDRKPMKRLLAKLGWELEGSALAEQNAADVAGLEEAPEAADEEADGVRDVRDVHEPAPAEDEPHHHP